MIVGASYDIQGSSRAQLHLHQILDASGVNAVVMPGSEFLLGRVQHAFDENGDLKDQGTIDFLESCFFRFIHFANIANQLNQPEDVRFEPGTYHVTTVGHNGDLPMSVTLSEDRIEVIDIDSSGETGGIADVVFTRIPDEIIEGQTLNFDSKLLYRIQTYLGGKRKDLKGHEIHGNYELISVLTERALESVRWLENIGVEFLRDEVTMPVGAIWRRGHKPKVSMGVTYIRFRFENGGIILTDTQVKERVVTDGIVTGVKGSGRNG